MPFHGVVIVLMYEPRTLILSSPNMHKQNLSGGVL